MAAAANIHARVANLEATMGRLIRVGEVVQVEQPGRVRVALRDEDDIETDWLQVLVHRPEDGDDYNMPALGSQGVCLFLPGGSESGFFIGGIWDVDDTTQPAAVETRQIGGDTIELVGATLIGLTAPDVTIDATNTIHLTAADIHITGDVQLGKGPPWYAAARAEIVQDVFNQILALLPSMGPLGNSGFPVAFVTDVLGNTTASGVAPPIVGGVVAVAAGIKAGTLLAIPSNSVEVD